MVTYYEVKELVCRLFGYRDIEINDDDISVVMRNRHLSGSDYSFVIKNEELKEIYDRTCQVNDNGLEMFTGYRYEVAIDVDYPMMRRQEFPILSNDEENHIKYEIGFCSIEYCIYLLCMIIEKSHQENKRRVVLPMKLRRVIDGRFIMEENEELDWKRVLTQGLRELSIKIYDENANNIEKFRIKKVAYIFEFMYKSERAVLEYTDLEDMFPIRGFQRNIVDIATVETIPHREYINDVVDYYRLAFSSTDPYIKFISFYHVMEYFYDEVFKKKIVADLMGKITHPDFSYKNEDKVYEIATFVKNRMRMNDESGQGDELESLKYVLKEYINIEQLKDKLKQIDLESISYYQNNKVLFCKAPAIPWNDAEGVYTQIAKRIYFTRNALIHSKSGKNRERYRPYKDEKSLQKEIPLVRVIAEMIIINSSRIV